LYPSEDDIQDVIRGCRTNDRRSQEELYKRYYPAMMALCLRYVREPGDAVAVLNDAYLKVFRQLARYDPAKGTLYTWMRKILINTSLDSLRRQKLLRQHEMPMTAGEEPGIENEAISRLNGDVLLGAILQLPVTTRIVFNLYTVEGFTHREIAGMLEMREGTSRWHLSEARRQLKQIIHLMEPKV
jgi:RNA polymerase sigma factor (sigma-70 family)